MANFDIFDDLNQFIAEDKSNFDELELSLGENETSTNSIDGSAKKSKSRKIVKETRTIEEILNNSVGTHLNVSGNASTSTDGCRRSLRGKNKTIEMPTELSLPVRGRGRGRSRARGRGRNNNRRTAPSNNDECEVITLDDSYPLLNYPIPNNRPDNVIDLDSDDDKNNSAVLEEENCCLSLKIQWKSKIEKYDIRRHQKICTLLKMIAEREGTDVTNIVLNSDDRLILPDDTPASINYSIDQFIYGRIIDPTKDEAVDMAIFGKKKKNKNLIELRVQSATMKKPLIIQIDKKEKMTILVIKCAEELNLKATAIQLEFDGEELNLNETPEDLDMEGGEILDLKIVN